MRMTHCTWVWRGWLVFLIKTPFHRCVFLVEWQYANGSKWQYINVSSLVLLDLPEYQFSSWVSVSSALRMGFGTARCIESGMEEMAFWLSLEDRVEFGQEWEQTSSKSAQWFEQRQIPRNVLHRPFRARERMNEWEVVGEQMWYRWKSLQLGKRRTELTIFCHLLIVWSEVRHLTSVRLSHFICTTGQ